MHGTVTKKGNRWYAVVYEGTDDAGKPKRRWIAAGARKADAERVLADLIRKKHEGEPLVAHKGTLGPVITLVWPMWRSAVKKRVMAIPGGKGVQSRVDRHHGKPSPIFETMVRFSFLLPLTDATVGSDRADAVEVADD